MGTPAGGAKGRAVGRCAGHYPHHHRMDAQGNGGAFGGDAFSVDGSGESAPMPLKLPPEHLFTCTVGRNRSQARRGRRRSCCDPTSLILYCCRQGKREKSRRVLKRRPARCLQSGRGAFACTAFWWTAHLHADVRFDATAHVMRGRYFLTGSSEVGGLLAQLAESKQPSAPRAA